MSQNLWRYLLEDDVDTFRQYLANATFASGASKVFTQGGHAGLRVGSPSSLAVSPKTPLKTRKSSANTPTSASVGRNAGLVLTRADLNSKDSFGRTLLHHAASSRSEDALAFVRALLDSPFIDLYTQDAESGWTALHRALYSGNISVAHALMARDIQYATDYTTNTQHSHAGGLVKIKDHEGNSPFEVFGLTIAPRSLQQSSSTLPSGLEDAGSVNSMDYNEAQDPGSRVMVYPLVDLEGDEVYAFGSNKNLSLGVGDGDDRHFPERLQLSRPDHLLHRLLEDHLGARQHSSINDDLASSRGYLPSQNDLPAAIRFKPITIQNVVMSKLHTAVLTNDPVSNLYMCGFGVGGRLGTGDENTSFSYKCIQAGGLAKRRISAIALGQDHTVAVCSQGETYTWGSNRYGQLGYSLPEVPKNEVPTQLTPRQLYGYIKKELVVGAAASAIHSALFTATALYTFGKNEGQLGLMDADARSLEIQELPRRIGVSILQYPIESVSAIDRATIVLLDNHDVIVFTHYGWTRILFPLETFSNYYLSDSTITRYNMETNYITQVTGGGSTICAMSSFGEVYAIDVPKVSENVPSNASTTNPTKARNALSPPARLWSIRKAHMSAIDVAVGQDGSIVLCTASGSVWRKEKRANIKSVREMHVGPARTKDYKFVRVPNLTRAIGVRSNAFGAFTAIRKDCTVTRNQIVPEPPSLWNDLFRLLPFAQYGSPEDPDGLGAHPVDICSALITRVDAEQDMCDICKRYGPLSESQFDLWITSNLTDVRIPIHAFMLTSRSRIMRSALTEFQESYYFSIPDVMSIEYGADGQIQLTFQGADFLTIVNLVLYLYTDNVADVWHYTSRALQSAARYRSVRIELLKIATHLELRQLERAVRIMTGPARTLANDMELAFLDTEFFYDADVLIELAGGVELPAHSVLLCARCPFFDGMFNGRAGGMWMASRRNRATEDSEVVRVDLKHMDERIFNMVLRHLYADTGEEMFDDIVAKSLDEFIDMVIEVLSAANELMVDRLAQICQQTLGKYVNARNVCSLLNTVAECTVEDFKRAALEYICLNLESMLEMKLLDELDEDLLAELDAVVQANQLAFLPFARSDRAEAELLENYPDLSADIETSRQRRIDSMGLRSRLAEDEARHASAAKFRVGSIDRQMSSSVPKSPLLTPSGESPAITPSPSPAIAPNDTMDDLPFEMDDDSPRMLPGPANERPQSIAKSPPVREYAGPMSKSKTTTELSNTPRTPRAGFPSSSRPRSEDVLPSPSPPVAIAGFETSRAAWHLPVHSPPKDGLKDIMEQTSASRVSNLTQAMRTVSAPAKGGVKMSQKERKRQQQLLKDQEATTSLSPIPSKEQSTKVPSPWQTVAKPPKSAASPILAKPDATTDMATQSPARSAMTMRQTVAGGSSTAKSSGKDADYGRSLPELAPPSKPAAPQIQSIRHTPLPSRTGSAIDARTSMAEILAQQQFEKTAVKEAVAKRSLQEIQQEQEFQQWWDNESRRVQEEEAHASPAASGRGKGGRGRGGHRRGSGRGGKSTLGAEASGRDKAATAASPTAGEDFGRGHGSQRGSGRGRSHGHGNTQQRGARHQ
ncbi:hypothetical protein LTR99_006338 [Exophiala xenobiotica]|uniref:BTB domain-containing protein n=1 Tax=Vermiconidia calcicola TaxID=1690605 RepID=A0AAV9Q941_9PEZI|nr:hypothetical protein LTR92_010295 [Exophiala xenobiotica]KAK5537508.1 hypothetical protein LTR25_004760 [Vermiconidia calcicola]KAK5539250.1 hypothetical protein LTR23_006666 [Chaetothyriales sp. CCFEE 6169]KAK5301371.1 hypothetical protein LTR99_006338 [Exophiala xenobiotica]KAK5378951.1 hypothetical protein LTS13_003843 [Exophiala xenobiotica]